MGDLPPSLEYLRVSANALSIDLQGSSRLSHLRLLYTSMYTWLKDNASAMDISEANQIRGGLSTELGQLTRLERLQLEGMQLTGRLPNELGRLTHLSRLMLAYNALTGSIPSSISHLTKLQYLSLESNPKLTGTLQSLCLHDLMLSSTLSMLNGSAAPVDFSADCLLPTISCTCCRVCC